MTKMTYYAAFQTSWFFMKSGMHVKSMKALLPVHNLLWPPCVADADVIFSSCGFFFLFSSSFSLRNLSGWRLDVYRTSAHGVALVQI